MIFQFTNQNVLLLFFHVLQPKFLYWEYVLEQATQVVVTTFAKIKMGHFFIECNLPNNRAKRADMLSASENVTLQ